MRRGGDQASHRGGAPSSARAKLARKLNKSSSSLADPVGLLRVLWPREGDALARLGGTPDQCLAMVTSYMTKHNVKHTSSGWEIGAGGSDPWTSQGDPWAAARGTGPVTHNIAEDEKMSDFEKLDLISTVVNDEGKALQLIRRDNFSARMEGVVLSDAVHVPSLLAMSGDKANLLILAPSRVVKAGVCSERTQILTNKDGKTVTKYAFAAFVGTSRHSIIHPAADVRLEESMGVQVTMKAVKHLVAEDIYEDFANKDKVCSCLAKLEVGGAAHQSIPRSQGYYCDRCHPGDGHGRGDCKDQQAVQLHRCSLRSAKH